MSQEELARKLGYKDRSTIAKIEAGVNDLTQSKISAVADALQTTTAYLMGWEDEPISRRSVPSNIIPMPQTYQVPLLGKIACGQPILAVEEAEETVEVPSWIKADFALQCQGDSMVEARILDGDIVYIRSQEEVENGQIAAVLVEDNGSWEDTATLKRYYKYPGAISLRAANPAYPDMDYIGEEMSRVRVLGLVVGFTSTKIK